MRFDDWFKDAQARLKAAGSESYRLDALILAEAVLERGRASLLAHPELQLGQDQAKTLQRYIARREQREPVALILGRKEFYGRSFTVTPDTLVPRPETEAMVEHAARTAPDGASALDVGTGSGCIAISLKLERPDTDVRACDISDGALDAARKNAERLGADVAFFASDLLERAGSFDLILANLPYVPVGERRPPELDYEPGTALYGGEDGLDLYRRFLAQLPQHLNTGGLALIEASPVQHHRLAKLASSYGLSLEEVTEYISLLRQ